MKLITAIVNKEDSKNVCNELLKSKFYVTRLATRGYCYENDYRDRQQGRRKCCL